MACRRCVASRASSSRARARAHALGVQVLDGEHDAGGVVAGRRLVEVDLLEQRAHVHDDAHLCTRRKRTNGLPRTRGREDGS
eukprot:1752811-Pleurochrysis_carterae.AAC.3